MLLNLSYGKQDFLKEIVESFANKSGQSTLFDALFERGISRERSFLGTDDIGNISVHPPERMELARHDIGKTCHFKCILCILTLCSCRCVNYRYLNIADYD